MGRNSHELCSGPGKGDIAPSEQEGHIQLFCFQLGRKERSLRVYKQGVGFLRLRFIKSILFGILAFIVYPNTFMKNKNSESQNMKLRKIKLVVSIILSLIFISM